MKHTAIILSLALLAGLSAQAQTRILITHVQAVTKADTVNGSDATITLNNAEGADNALILQVNDLLAKVRARVSTQNSARSSLKDSAVHLKLDITLKAGRDKDNKVVEKVFYMDQQRKGMVTQRFNFKDGITMRTITLSFNVEIE